MSPMCGCRGGGVRLREVVAPFRTPETNEQPRSVQPGAARPPGCSVLHYQFISDT